MQDDLLIKLTHDEAFVLFEFFSRFDDTHELRLVHNAEYLALSKISANIETTLVEPFNNPQYQEQLDAARQRVAEGYEGLAPGVDEL